MDGVVRPWVRIGLVVLAPANIATGLWALVATRSWFDDFPGVGARLVAAEPPFNEHLARDAGAGFLATGVALLAAAALGRRNAVLVALLAYVTFSLPHLVYHAANQPAALSGAAQAVNVALLSSSVVLALVLAWGARPTAATAG
jgi:hypothetical protein